MAKPRPIDPPKSRTISLPTSLWDYIDSLGYDPVRKKLRYGHVASYCTRLVKNDKRARKAINTLTASDKDLK